MTITLNTCLLEAAIILLGKLEASIRKVVCMQAHKLVALTTEVRTNVASCAVILLEELVTLLCLLRNGSIITIEILIEGRVGRQQCTLELLNSISNCCLGDTLLGVALAECTHHLRILLELCHDHIERGRSHLHGVHRRTSSLIGQGCSTTIPELHEVVDCIENGRSIYATKLACNTLRILTIVDARSIQAVARSARYGIINRKASVVIESHAESHLRSIHGQRLSNRAYRLASAITCQTIVVVGCAIVHHPIEDDFTLSLGHIATPMHQVVLRHRHTLIQSDLLDLGYIHGRGHLIRLESLHKRSDVERAIARLDILHNNITCHGYLRIEGHIRFGGVAIQATALDKDCSHASTLRIVGRRYSIRDAPYSQQHRHQRQGQD